VKEGNMSGLFSKSFGSVGITFPFPFKKYSSYSLVHIICDVTDQQGEKLVEETVIPEIQPSESVQPWQWWFSI
jgi:hypothetical protein